ncbi:hypothetical protein TNCV_389011 [Trichonephila clavipes]|nr:hypothetical protein TNCV_389011 [Trichonephila clavipes]
METFQILTEANGNETSSRAHMFEWPKRFSWGRDSVEDDERASYPRKNNKQMFLNMVYALSSLQWLLRTVSAYSEPARATFLAVAVPILQSAFV